MRGTVTTFRDITDEHNRRLLTERLLEQLFEALPTAVVVAHPETGEILSANRAFGELVGQAPEELARDDRSLLRGRPRCRSSTSTPDDPAIAGRALAPQGRTPRAGRDHAARRSAKTTERRSRTSA